MADPANDAVTTGREPVSAEGPDAQATGFTREYVDKLRDEAATYRQKLRESEAQVTAAQEQVSGLQEQLETANGQVAELSDLKPKTLRYEAAAEAGLPLKHASRLQGETFEELTNDAKSLAEAITSKPSPKDSFNPGAGQQPPTNRTIGDVLAGMVKGDD